MGAAGCEQAAVRVVSHKNRGQFGQRQFVTVSHPKVIAWLRVLLVEGKDERLWSKKTTHLSKLVKVPVTELKVTGCGFTPWSLRPGGATMFHSEGIAIPTLRFMGRWTVEHSLEHCIEQAVATRILCRRSSKK